MYGVVQCLSVLLELTLLIINKRITKNTGCIPVSCGAFETVPEKVPEQEFLDSGQFFGRENIFFCLFI